MSALPNKKIFFGNARERRLDRSLSLSLSLSWATIRSSSPYIFAEVREEGWPSWSVNHEVGEAVEAFTVLKVKRVLLWETSVAERQKLEGEVSCISALEMRWGEQW